MGSITRSIRRCSWEIAALLFSLRLPCENERKRSLTGFRAAEAPGEARRTESIPNYLMPVLIGVDLARVLLGSRRGETEGKSINPRK